jgi:hypothetical protein
MRGFIAKSAQNITALTTARAAMKVQIISTTQEKKFFHPVQRKLSQNGNNRLG